MQGLINAGLDICSKEENILQSPWLVSSRAIPCSTAGALWQEYVENPIYVESQGKYKNRKPGKIHKTFQHPINCNAASDTNSLGCAIILGR